MPRLPVLIRQNRVFELVVQGRGYSDICKQLDISEDTVARDMQAISTEIQELTRTRAGEVLAVALATYQKIIDTAWREYHAAAERERAWYAGRLDYEHESVSTKTLALEGEADETDGGKSRPRKQDAAQAALAALALQSESQPLEVKRTRRTVRPALVGSGRREWLALIVETTRELTELLGVKKVLIEHSGQGGGAIALRLTDDERSARIAELLDRGRNRRAGLAADPESGGLP